jgi:hypothetical protein
MHKPKNPVPAFPRLWPWALCVSAALLSLVPQLLRRKTNTPADTAPADQPAAQDYLQPHEALQALASRPEGGTHLEAGASREPYAAPQPTALLEAKAVPAQARFPHYGQRLSWNEQALEALELESLPPEGAHHLLVEANRMWTELEALLLQSSVEQLGPVVDRQTADEAFLAGECAYVLSPPAPSRQRRYILVSTNPDPRALELRQLANSLLRTEGMHTHARRSCHGVLPAGSNWSLQDLRLKPSQRGDGLEVYAPTGELVAVHLPAVPGSP